jgi:hypothetical protein
LRSFTKGNKSIKKVQPAPDFPPQLASGKDCMSQDSTEHHLEHAEHVHHAALKPFDRQVAMSMAIIAAGLAGVTLLSHRGHNDTLSLQTEANILHTRANISHTRASDMWGFYQAKNIRSHEFQAYLMMAAFLPSEPANAPAKQKALKYWADQVEKYEGRKAQDARPGELAEIMREARKLEDEAQTLQKEAQVKEQESQRVHHSVNWIDFGHLGLELALVLCSVAILAKVRFFWYSGIVVAVVGAGLALEGVYSLLLTPH